MLSVAADGRLVACPWVLRRVLNAALVPPAPRVVQYEVRPTSARPHEPMAEIWVDGVFRWLVHRKVRQIGVDPPDPKKWRDETSGQWIVLRHGEGHYCDDCPANKRDALISTGPKTYCPPGERCV